MLARWRSEITWASLIGHAATDQRVEFPLNLYLIEYQDIVR